MNDDDVHYIDDGGIRASEPPGEGAVGCSVVEHYDNIFNGGGSGGGGSQYYVDLLLSFVKIRIFDADFGLQSRILTPSRVEMIDKRSILCLELQPIDTATQGLSKTPIIAFLRPIQAKIWRNGGIWRE